MPRTRVSLNAKAHYLGWLKPNNLKLATVCRLTKTTSNNCKSLIKDLLTAYYNNHIPVPSEKNKLFAQWFTNKLINFKTWKKKKRKQF